MPLCAWARESAQPECNCARSIWERSHKQRCTELQAAVNKLECQVTRVRTQHEEACAQLAKQQATRTAADTWPLCAELQAAVTKLEGQVARVRTQHEEAMARLQDKRQRLKECDAAAQTLRKQLAALQGRLSDCSVERKKTQHRLALPAWLSRKGRSCLCG